MLALLVCASLWAATARPVHSHEERGVASLRMRVGWAEEPPYVGFPNAVALRLTDASGAPVDVAGDQLLVAVVFGELTLGPVPVQPVSGQPGEHRFPLVPTRPGTYTFRFTGSVRGEHVDQSFTSSERTFEAVREPSDVQFPAKDPSAGQLAARLERMEGRTEGVAGAARSTATSARTAARRATWLAAAGIALGLVALGVATLRGRKGP